CVGACSLAPVLVVNEESHGRMTPEEAWRLLKELDDARSDPAVTAEEAV
ncbi:MAG: NAD(P)H-dependent oxidoreductase subunit E, partial [Anaerolineae bacterium]